MVPFSLQPRQQSALQKVGGGLTPRRLKDPDSGTKNRKRSRKSLGWLLLGCFSPTAPDPIHPQNPSDLRLCTLKRTPWLGRMRRLGRNEKEGGRRWVSPPNAILDQFPFPTELLRGEGICLSIEVSPRGKVASGKLKEGLLFWKSLTAIYWEAVTVTMQIHNEYKEWCPLELFDSHLVQSQWQSPSRI